MKIDLSRAPLRIWQALTAVPGWPDAPWPMRARRALPFLLPCLGILALAAAEFAVDRPRARAARAAVEPLIAAEAETTALQLRWSDRQAAELVERAADAARGLLPSPAAAPAALAALSEAAAREHWKGRFQLSALAPETAPGSPVGFLTCRGKLSPAAENAQPFPTLLAFLGRFERDGQGIDLTRLAIRADEEGRYSAETTLRLACRISP